MKSQDIVEALMQGRSYVMNKKTRDVYRIDGIATTPSIHITNVETGEQKTFAEGGATWSEFTLLKESEQ